jgi:hypothetical protein
MTALHERVVRIGHAELQDYAHRGDEGLRALLASKGVELDRPFRFVEFPGDVVYPVRVFQQVSDEHVKGVTFT